jgi:hypothetical protein
MGSIETANAVAVLVKAMVRTGWPKDSSEVTAYFDRFSCETSTAVLNESRTLLVGDWQNRDLMLSGSWMSSGKTGSITLSFFIPGALLRRVEHPLLYSELIAHFSAEWGEPAEFDADLVSPRACWAADGLIISLDSHGRVADPPLVQVTLEPAKG